MFRQVCVRIFPERFLRNITISFSSLSLKEQLLKDLKNIRGCISAEKLFGQLVYAKNTFVIPGTEPMHSWFNYKITTEFNIQCMQCIIDHERPKYHLIDMIWMVLHESEIDLKGTTDVSGKDNLNSLLMNIRDFTADYSKIELHSKEFIKHILKDMEYIISSCDEHSLYFQYCQKYPPGGLGLFQFVLVKLLVNNVNKLLYSVFQVGRAQLHFSEGEKRRFGTLMVETIEPIYNSILEMKTVEFHISWLQIRSALQFYKDIFGKFPTGNEMLLENFYMDRVDRSIKMLDKEITSWCVVVSECIAEHRLEDLYYLEPEDYKNLEEAGASEMPKSHIWWAECSALLKKAKSFEMPQA